MYRIGIDLGTSNSLIAYWAEDGPVIIPNEFGENLTPSVVSVDENGDILVGRIARERLITHPGSTAASFKRFMGTQKQFCLGGMNFSAEDLSSFVLKSLKADAEERLGEKVSQAVISVPAYFNDLQRKATKAAAELAGLEVERLVSEPTAAALSHGLHMREEGTFLVFDLGGGTFDVSILEFFEGIIEVKSVAGDNFLGGEDFTNLIADAFIKKHGLQCLDEKLRKQVVKRAEVCKRELEHERSAALQFEYDGEGFESTFTRDELEKMAADLLLKMRTTMQRAMHDAGLKPDDLDAVIPVGGATRMYAVKSLFGKVFKRLPLTKIHPDEAIALGAAVQAALKGSDRALEEMILTDVCPFTLGIRTARKEGEGSNAVLIDGLFNPIIERNSPIPISIERRFSTLNDKQRRITVAVYQGESMKVENNLYLGELEVKVPAKPAGEEGVDVRFTYDINGILEVEVTVAATGVKERMVIEKEKGRYSPEEIESRLRELGKLKIHPREQAENRLLLARGERMYEEALGMERMLISEQLSAFELVLEGQNPHDIKKAAVQLKSFLDSMEHDRMF